MNFTSISPRWLWLTAGIIAIIGLTGLNVYSLYQLRNHSVDTIQQSKILQVAEFADRTRHRFIHPFYGLGSLDIKKNEQQFERNGNFTDKFLKIISQASKDSIFKNIYYVPAESKVCYRKNEPILRFNHSKNKFEAISKCSAVICDGLGMARTRMRALIKEYEFNNKVLFDTHRSLTLALVNLSSQSVVGYLVMPINQSFLINKYIQPQLVKYFGGDNEGEGITVWLRYWTKQQVLASSDPSKKYVQDHIQYIHQFPDLFDDWRLYVAMDESVLAASQNNSFALNLVLLSVAFIFLIGALIFMFVAAQRERGLAKRQSAFLANVTHGLKTPLAAMQAAGENLSDGRIKNEERIQKYGSHIYSEALRLRQMIEKLLNVARTDNSQNFVKRGPCSIDLLVQQYVEEHKYYIYDEGFSLEVNIEPDLPPVLLDEQSFYPILNNLVRNAIKYSAEDKFLKISLFSTKKTIILKVQDHGVGMDSKTLRHVFEKFYRAQNSLTKKSDGYGLGLSIVKNLVELNNGKISVESEEDKGTVFMVKFATLNKVTKAQKIKMDEYEFAKN